VDAFAVDIHRNNLTVIIRKAEDQDLRHELAYLAWRKMTTAATCLSGSGPAS